MPADLSTKKELEIIKKQVLKLDDFDGTIKDSDVYYIYTYELKNLPAPRKVLFSFALFGRKNSKGLIDEIGGEKLGSGCIFVPEKSSKKIEEFFDYWKANYRRIKVKVLERTE